MIEIRPIKPGEIDGAIIVMDAVFHELWGVSYADIQANFDPLDDIEDKSLGFLPISQDTEDNGPIHMELVLGEGKKLIPED
jgi:hypothetical protein